jgi:hypothetical protein
MNDQESLEVACLRIVASTFLRDPEDNDTRYYGTIALEAADLHLKYIKYLRANEKVLNEKI